VDFPADLSQLIRVKWESWEHVLNFLWCWLSVSKLIFVVDYRDSKMVSRGNRKASQRVQLASAV
jgi:hypothetical protein